MTVHEQVLQNMREMAEEFSRLGIELQMPPPTNTTLGTLYTELDFGKTIAAQVPFDPRFTNPLRMYQGGFLAAVFDEVYGPLTYMASGRPVVTIEMSTTFVRPFTAKDEYVVVKAELVSKSRTLLVLKAEARSKNGKLIATSTSHSLVVTDQNINAQGAPARAEASVR